MQKIASFLKTPYFFQWLIVFFALNSYSDFIGDVTFSSLLLLILKLSIAGWMLFFVCGKIYKDSYKAALFVTVILFCYFFFGAIQDYLRTIRALAPLSTIRVFFLLNVVVCTIAFTALFLYKKSLLRFTRLLNLLFLVYIIYDVAVILWVQVKPDKKMAAPAVSVTPLPATVSKPDIYFILLDEYLGTAGLNDYFKYDNTPFESFLQQRGFYVCRKPVSNYSYTVYSMASLFSMGYIDSLCVKAGREKVYRAMTGLINHNQTWSFLQQLQYRIHNLSPFVVAGQQPITKFNLVPAGIDLIMDKTAYNRIVKNLPYGNLLADLQLNFISKRIYKQLDEENESMMKAALTPTLNKQPTFTYLHLMMPHRPYIYDKKGKWSFSKQYKGSKEAVKDSLYLNYLVYANNRISRFIDQLYRQTNGKAVIVLMSDHGYRREGGKAPRRIRFSTLNAVYLPNRDYQLWYEGVSNVNKFPLLFNTLFNQQIPLQKDSCHF
jgi:hypothetical protein